MHFFGESFTYFILVNVSTITYITLHLRRAPRINSLPFEIKTHPSNLINVPQFFFTKYKSGEHAYKTNLGSHVQSLFFRVFNGRLIEGLLEPRLRV